MSLPIPEAVALRYWLAEYSAIKVAERQVAEVPKGKVARLISQRAYKSLFRAFGQRALPFFDLYHDLYLMSLGAPVPPEGLVVPFRAATRMVFQSLVREETKNLFTEAKSELQQLFRKVEKGRASPNVWRQIAVFYGDLIIEVAQDRDAFLKPRMLPGQWRFLTAMSDKETKFQRLRREDPALYESILEARQKLKGIDTEIEKQILDLGMTPGRIRLMGRPVMTGEDPATGERWVFDVDGDLLLIPDYFAKYSRGDGAKRRLTRAFPLDVTDLQSYTDEEIEAFAEGPVEYLALTDDKPKQSGVTRIYATQIMEGEPVVVKGRFKGYKVDDLINIAGRMIEGVAYDYDPKRGIPVPMETKNPDGTTNVSVSREPYATVRSQDDDLYLRIPTNRKFTQVRNDVHELSTMVPSIKYVRGSYKAAYTFQPNDFADLREATGGLALSTGAVDRLHTHFTGLARHELATARENLKHFSLSRIGGFRQFKVGRPDKPLDLFNKQKEGLAWVTSRGNSGVCALDTGVGKTPIAVAAIQKMIRDGEGAEDTNGRFLYACPAALVGNLVKTAHGFLEDGDAFLDKVDIVSHAQFAKNRRKDPNYGLDYVSVLVDEAHQIAKKPNSPPAKALMSLNHPRKILLTASPMEKDPMQLFLLVAISNNIDLNTKEGRAAVRGFRKRYAEEIGGRIVGIKKDPATARAFRVWVKQNLFFADKRDVEEVALPSLRPETEVIVMDPEVEVAYRQATKGIEKALRGLVKKYRDRDPKATDPAIEAMFGLKLRALLGKLNDLANMPDLVVPGARNPKIDRSAEIIEERVGQGRRTLLFTDSPKMASHTAKNLSLRFPGLYHAVALSDRIEVYVNGEIAQAEMRYRNKVQMRPMVFRKRKYPEAVALGLKKANDWKVYILKYVIGGNRRVKTLTLTSGYAVGQNLQMFDTVIHLDRDAWNSETMKQRTARAWRAGQKTSVDEYTLDAVYAEQRDEWDETLDQIRRHMQELQSDLFDRVVIESQTEALGKEWFEMKHTDASFHELNRRMMEMALSPYLARMGKTEGLE
jgi:hypothetical protein